MTYPGLGGQQRPPLGIPQGQSPVLGIQAGVPAPRAFWLPEVITDATTRTVGASFAQLSGAFSIAANDAAVGGVYKLACWGTFTASNPTINLRPVLFGVNLATLTTGPPVGPYRVDAWIMVTTPGAAGSCNGIISWVSDVAPIAAIIPATTVNTRLASTFELQADVSSGTMTGVGSVYERDGPGAFQ
jgi:hypothetical protein